MTLRFIPVLTVLSTLSAVSGQAALFSFQSGNSLVSGTSLTGTVTYEGWDQLTTSRLNNNPVIAGDNTTRPYGWHNLTTAWNTTLPSNLGSGMSLLGKSGGYGYIAGSSLHQGAQTNSVLPGGSFSISTSAITGLQTLIFQIQATDREESLFHAAPVLRFGATNLPPAFSGLYQTTENFAPGFGGQDLDSYAFQWDLSAQAIAAGTPMSIQWTGLVNSGIYELQLYQANTFAQVVPEPGAAGLLALTGLSLLTRRRRQN